MSHTIKELTERIYEINVANGWFDTERTLEQDLVLLMTELGEACETLRDPAHPAPEAWVDPFGKPEGLPSELADVLIRLLDLAKRREIDMDEALRSKLAYNAQRGYRHGGKML